MCKHVDEWILVIVKVCSKALPIGAAQVLQFEESSFRKEIGHNHLFIKAVPVDDLHP